MGVIIPESQCQTRKNYTIQQQQQSSSSALWRQGWRWRRGYFNMGYLEDSLSFATNFLTQILAIIATGVVASKYIIAENRKGQERLGRRILGPDLDGKSGMLHDIVVDYTQGLARIEKTSQQETDKKLEQLEKDLDNKITDKHKQLLFEFQKTSMRINYMSRNFGRMEQSLEKLTGGRYIADKTELNREEHSYYNPDGDAGDHNEEPSDNYSKRKRGKGI